MTKLIALRVTLAVDDAVDLKDAKARLAAIINERGTEAIDGSGRIHWGTAEILQGPERAPLRSRSKRAGAKDEGTGLFTEGRA